MSNDENNFGENNFFHHIGYNVSIHLTNFEPKNILVVGGRSGNFIRGTVQYYFKVWRVNIINILCREVKIETRKNYMFLGMFKKLHFKTPCFF